MHRLLLPLCLLLSACANPFFMQTSTSTQLRILALGDSYTEGTYVQPSDSWPSQLAKRLGEEGYRVSELNVIARGGWTTDELQTGIDLANPQGPYHLVTLLIGANNQFRGYPLDDYRDEFQALLDRAVTFAGGNPGRVIVLSIPDWSVSPFARGQNVARIGAEINAYNRINQAAAELAGAYYVDVTSISRQAATDPTLLAGDGLHPSGQMYSLWVEEIVPVVLEISN
jgi:lysophospholipase L1-like esterase